MNMKQNSNSLFNTKQFKNSFKIYKANFGVIFASTLALAITFVACIIAYELLGSYDMGITGICLFAFVFLAMLFAFQIVIGKICAGKDVGYYDIYKYFRTYYQKNNFGVYRVIRAILLSFLVGMAFTYLAWVLYDFIYQGVLTDLMTSMINSATDGDSDTLYNLLIEIYNMPNFMYFYITPIGLAFICFFKRIRNRSLLPYFNQSVVTPPGLSNLIYNNFFKRNASKIKRDVRLSSLIFDLVFIASLIGGEFLFINVVTFQYVDLILCTTIAFSCIITSLVMPLVLIDTCFAADNYQMLYLNETKDFLQRQARQMQDTLNRDKEAADKLNEIFDKMKDEYEKNHPESDDDSQDDNTDQDNNE